MPVVHDARGSDTRDGLPLKGVTPAVCRGIDGSGVFKSECTPAVGQMSSVEWPRKALTPAVCRSIDGSGVFKT